jgi:hypothetical protein
MSIHSATKPEEQREEAIRLLFSGIQFPVAIPHELVNEVAKQVVKGADVLFNYIKTGKTD